MQNHEQKVSRHNYICKELNALYAAIMTVMELDSEIEREEL